FVAMLALPATAQEVWQVSGFALMRAASAPVSGPLGRDPSENEPLDSETLEAQVQVGIDWLPSPMYGAHLHLLGRSDNADTRRGTFGIAEAYFDANFVPNGDRLRLRGGAFFLPTSRENVDALWEPAYTLTPSALNSWLGEELRPIGVDAAYFRGRAVVGATLFRGNDTFGAVPVARGWQLSDHWITLGEWVAVDATDFTSVSAETDGRLGWSARGAWNGEDLLVQLTHIDNRSDGRKYGDLFNWNTRFDIAAVEYSRGDWTVAGEYGWGPTFLVLDDGRKFGNELAASYLMVSRWWRHGRATFRADWFDVDDDHRRALTAAFLWTPPGKIRPAIEVTTAGGEQRVLLEVRYSFSGG
ncbi:MAG TPA: hypothetical protein VEK57_20895, partial [Thermoanaerobaculia bacterium]|nr:hypothetical protein [Thermoanaerobaculia bacterium]